jgi:ribonuclease R
MKQARYSADNLGHFGLASACYCHFTSPIRRYPDLVVHRILRAALALEERKGDRRAEKQLAIATERLAETAEHTSKRERVAMEAERDVVEMKKLQYMQQHLGEEFDGYIAGVAGFGFFVELEELFVEGLVHLSTLTDDLYSYAEKQHSLIGRRSRRVFRIGDKARVKVAAVSPATRRIEFVLTAHVPSAPPPRPSAIVRPDEEFPRIPIKGKRISGIKRRPAGGERDDSPAGARHGGGKKKR